MRTFAIIPVRNRVDLTQRVLRCLAHEPVDDVLILDNGSTDATAGTLRIMQRRYPWQGRLHRSWQPGASIYEMWNTGFARARREAARRWFGVLVLNNDITLPPGWVTALREAIAPERAGVWASYPDADAAWAPVAPPLLSVRETRGVFSDGGLFGPCFMLAGNRIPWRPLITDLSYEWWWGDNHLAECIEQEGGKQVRVVGLPVTHENEATARLYPELERAKLRDRGRWLTREQRGARAIERGGA